MALAIDQAVRIWIDYVLNQAALCAANEKTPVWLEKSQDLSKNDDTAIIINLLKYGLENSGEIPDESKNRKKQLIKDRIEKLELFRDFNQKLLELMKEELDNIS